ncbi:MAG: SIR2 family protein [Methylovulum miyakonense]|uniref:SIR2 family protein n=1 Tax=Methylovulum miyakonense TaxID=645578 RepID=UPI003BB803CC
MLPYIYTLNIDDAIEKNSKYGPVRPYKKLSNSVTELNCVFKMHGDVIDELTYDELPNIIFSQEQYIKSLERNTYILNFFQSDYSSKNILFIGCSLDDELDLKYAISTTQGLDNSSISRIYVTDSEPKGLRKSRLEDFGITKILLINDYQNFYNFLFDIYDKSRFLEEKPFEQFKNPVIEVCKKDLKINKDFLLDIAGVKSSEITLPFFAVDREIATRIASEISNDVVTVISGKRYSGKTFLSKTLIRFLSNKDVYFFSSNISFNDSEIRDLIKLERSYLIFDSNSINVNNLNELEFFIPEFRKINTNLIILCNKSDNLINSAAAMLTNSNYFNLVSVLTEKEIDEVNYKLSEIGLIKLDTKKTLIDNCLKAFHVYEERIPFKVELMTDKEFMLTVILSSDSKVYSVIFNLMEINRIEIKDYVSKFSQFVEIQDTNKIELHQHSGYKIISNSSGWLFRILNEYKNKTGHKRVVKNICELVDKLIKNKAFNYLYKKIINFDNLNQIFYGEDKGEAGLILNLYENLEPILYSDNHFWLQRAKSILNLKRFEIDSLRLAVDYAKKAYHDTDNEKLKINSTTTIALIYGRIAVINKFSNKQDLEDAINWYYMALQENQFNKRYVDDILQKTKRRNSDIKDICSFLLKNNIVFNNNEKKHAEYLINQVVRSNYS